MKIFSLLLCFIHSTAFANSAELQNILDRFSSESTTISRLDKFSQIFLGLPYGDGGPLGEGPEGRYDQDPLYRFDTFDCTTYVETIISLALSRSPREFEQQMDNIRFENGEVDYLKRNHFPSLQWIPHNIENGILKEINDLILPPSAQALATALIHLPNWLRAIKINEIKVPLASEAQKQDLLNELRAQAEFHAPIEARLRYIPISTLLNNPKLLDRIPHGSLVNFVRPNWDIRHLIGTHMNVSHQGLLFRKGRVLVLRHASNSEDKKVSELPFIDYLSKFRNHPTLKGVHLMGLN
jgi:hypothetical protein